MSFLSWSFSSLAAQRRYLAHSRSLVHIVDEWRCLSTCRCSTHYSSPIVLCWGLWYPFDNLPDWVLERLVSVPGSHSCWGVYVYISLVCLCVSACVSGCLCVWASEYPSGFLHMCVFPCDCCVHTSVSLCVSESVCVHIYHCEDIWVVCPCNCVPERVCSPL